MISGPAKKIGIGERTLNYQSDDDTADSLAQKVLVAEHRIYPKVVKAYCEDRIVWKNNQPKIEVVIEN